tara:strand:+ start:372 stop:1778 length:1407 start_codon:yes stop_codon:yes gene_type:complete
MIFPDNTNAAMAALANGGVDPNQQQVDPNQPMPTQNIDFIREMTKPARPRLNKFANFLMGFGAGYQGKGQEFLANQMRLSTARKSAAAKDLQTARDMLALDMQAARDQGLKVGSNPYKAFVSRRASDFLQNQRRPQIRRLGGTSDETDAITDLILTNPDDALRNMSEDIAVARRTGLLPQDEMGIENSYLYRKKADGSIEVVKDLAPDRNKSSGVKDFEFFQGQDDETKKEILEYREAGAMKLNQGQKLDQTLNPKLIGDLRESARAARNELYYLNTLSNLGTSTGSLSSFRANLSNLSTTLFGEDNQFTKSILGLDTSEAADLAKYKAVSDRMLNAVLNAAKGPQTEGDAQRARNTIPNIDNLTVVNEFIIATMRELAMDRKEMFDFVVRDMREQGTSPSALDAEQKYIQFRQDHPLIAKWTNPDGTRDLYFKFVETTQRNNPNLSREKIDALWKIKNENNGGFPEG